MRKHPKLVAGAAVVVALALSWCLSPRLRAQVSGLIPPSFNGQEVVAIALQGPGGSSEFATTGMFRNTVGNVTTAATSGTVTWPGSISKAGGIYAYIIATAACGGAATFNLPATPFDGQRVVLANASASAFTTGCVVATTDGSTIVPAAGNALTTLASGSSAELVYNLVANTWYRVR